MNVAPDQSRIIKMVSSAPFYQQCETACEQTAACLAWTWDPVRETCYLTDTPVQSRYLEYVSGVSKCSKGASPLDLPSSFRSFPSDCAELCGPPALLLNRCRLRRQARERRRLHVWRRLYVPPRHQRSERRLRASSLLPVLSQMTTA